MNYNCNPLREIQNKKEMNEKKANMELLISTLTKAPPNETAALLKRSVFAKVNSQGSGT